MTNSSYVEVVLEGSVELIKGFVVGFLEGRGIQGKAVFEEDDGAVKRELSPNCCVWSV